MLVDHCVQGKGNALRKNGTLWKLIYEGRALFWEMVLNLRILMWWGSMVSRGSS